MKTKNFKDLFKDTASLVEYYKAKKIKQQTGDKR